MILKSVRRWKGYLVNFLATYRCISSYFHLFRGENRGNYQILENTQMFRSRNCSFPALNDEKYTVINYEQKKTSPKLN